ncbi:hypothetical protein [Clostridium tyrobutyricum]|uniref:hypothetical protein n=1 Tax=Clostridium tyrobutyricum TaxID=1519 RepID=UPI001C385AC0|nr:hypothetical protein [Clostridium tyrobutyricum]MBV4426519.1 hypothetical protein [Clostridium tyrobutyricum]
MINISKFIQTNKVGSEVEALIAVVSPILLGITLSLNRSIVDKIGGLDNVSLELLSRLYKPGDGDCGISFEYAVHDAIINYNGQVLDKIDIALNKYCRINGGDPTSILFGAEKSGAMQLIESVKEHLTDESKLLTGVRGKPILLKRHISGVIGAFRKHSEREKLPSSINGLWKADLFVGRTEPDKWVGTTVKINPSQLEAARGLRLAIVPAKEGRTDKIYKNELKNLIVCPLPYDQSFMEIFYRGWMIAKQFLNAGAKLPKEVYLPIGADRQVCRFLEERRKFPILNVISALQSVTQQNLVSVEEKNVNIDSKTMINKIIAPISIQ